MGIKSSGYICQKCSNEGSFWNGEEFEECDQCESIDGEINDIQIIGSAESLELLDEDEIIENEIMDDFIDDFNDDDLN